MDIRELSIKSKFKSYLIKADYQTASEVLLTPPVLLARKTGLPAAEILELLLDLANAVESLPENLIKTVSEVLHEIPLGWFTTGDTSFDELLGGGIYVGQITEIAGQAASGKSHFALQLGLMVQLPIENAGLAGGALIVSSEGTMASPRLLAMAKTLVDRSKGEEQGNYVRNEWDFMDNVIFAKAEDPEALDNLLSFHIPAIIASHKEMADNSTPLPPITLTSKQGRPLQPDHPSFRSRPSLPPLPIKLIVIDSIAALFRIAHGNNSGGFIQRSKDLGMISDKLKRLGALHQCAIVVINQVSDVFQTFDYRLPPPDSKSSSQEDDGSPHIPAHIQYNLPGLMYNRFQIKHFSGQSKSLFMMASLGYGWTNLINTRVMLSRTGMRRKGEIGEDGEEQSDILIRKATLIFSPNAIRASMNYTLQDKNGLVGMSAPVPEEIRGSIDLEDFLDPFASEEVKEAEEERIES